MMNTIFSDISLKICIRKMLWINNSARENLIKLSPKKLKPHMRFRVEHKWHITPYPSVSSISFLQMQPKIYIVWKKVNSKSYRKWCGEFKNTSIFSPKFMVGAIMDFEYSDNSEIRNFCAAEKYTFFLLQPISTEI